VEFLYEPNFQWLGVGSTHVQGHYTHTNPEQDYIRQSTAVKLSVARRR